MNPNPARRHGPAPILFDIAQAGFKVQDFSFLFLADDGYLPFYPVMHAHDAMVAFHERDKHIGAHNWTNRCKALERQVSDKGGIAILNIEMNTFEGKTIFIDADTEGLILKDKRLSWKPEIVG